MCITDSNTFYNKTVKFLVYSLFAIVIAGIVYFAFEYIVPVILPFIIAWAIAALLQPIINFLDKHVKIPRKISVAVLVLFFVALLIYLCYLIINRAYTELSSLASALKQKATEIQSNTGIVDEWIDKINNAIPFVDVSESLHEYWDNIDSNLFSAITSSSTRIDRILPFLTSLTSGIINGFLSTIIVIVATFYFANDYKKIGKFIGTQFSESTRKFGTIVKLEFFATTGKYLRAYGLIILLTFVQLFAAFLILGIDYAFLLALGIALIDILPILGTGTILIPWGLWLIFAKGDVFTGIAILATYLIITIVRQIVEPKIVGSYIGLYPLVTLIMMYSGLRVLGLFGLFFFPISIIILKKLNDEGHIKLWKKVPDAEFSDGNDKKRFDINKVIHKKTKKK